MYSRYSQFITAHVKNHIFILLMLSIDSPSFNKLLLVFQNWVVEKLWILARLALSSDTTIQKSYKPVSSMRYMKFLSWWLHFHLVAPQIENFQLCPFAVALLETTVRDLIYWLCFCFFNHSTLQYDHCLLVCWVATWEVKLTATECYRGECKLCYPVVFLKIVMDLFSCMYL